MSPSETGVETNGLGAKSITPRAACRLRSCRSRPSTRKAETDTPPNGRGGSDRRKPLTRRAAAEATPAGDPFVLRRSPRCPMGPLANAAALRVGNDLRSIAYGCQASHPPSRQYVGSITSIRLTTRADPKPGRAHLRSGTSLGEGARTLSNHHPSGSPKAKRRAQPSTPTSPRKIDEKEAIAHQPEKNPIVSADAVCPDRSP